MQTLTSKGISSDIIQCLNSNKPIHKNKQTKATINYYSKYTATNITLRYTKKFRMGGMQ